MIHRPLVLALLAGACLGAAARAQGPLTTAFTYQGELRQSGAPAAGLYDLRFRLYDAPAAGAQLGPTLCADNLTPSAGRFTLDLDFGAQFNGQQRFLEIEVRQDSGLDCANAGGFTVLTPRQPLSAAPAASFALAAGTSSNATQFNGQPASFYQDASNLSSGTIPSARLAGTYSGALTLTNTSNVFAGNGAALTALNASSLVSGTIAPARLPAPLALAANSANSVIEGANASTASGASGISGIASAATGTVYGVSGRSNSPAGCGGYFFSPNIGALAESSGGDALYGRTSGATKSAVVGIHYTGTPGYGLYGQTDAPTSAAVYGRSLSLTGANQGGLFECSSAAGIAVKGVALGSSTSELSYGGWFESTSPFGTGLFARGNYTGITAYSTAPGGTAIFAVASANTSLNVAVSGFSNSPDGYGVSGGGGICGVSGTASRPTTGSGVQGIAHGNAASGVEGTADATTGSTFGGLFTAVSTAGVGCRGVATAASGTTFGGYFENASTTGYGCYGRTTAATGGNTGVLGQSGSTSGVGVWGYASNPSGGSTTKGVHGQNSSGAGYGVYSTGNLGASGLKTFRIDHPADPENRYLLHYSAESPEVINFYRGTVTLNATGAATIDLPPYFAAINADPSYTLTAIGAAMPALHVAREINPEALAGGAAVNPGEPIPACSFTIAGGAPNGRVCWRVEAVRNDRWVQAHGAPVESPKEAAERGTYQHPDLYGQPAERAASRLDEPVMARPRPAAPTPPRPLSPTVPAGPAIDQ
jgi:hypothetical protein